MRKIVATEYVTLDGVMEAPQAWSLEFWNDEAARFKLDELLASDALLLGRVTYQEFAAAWPSMTDDAGYAERMNDLPKYVVSTTMGTPEWKNSRVIGANFASELRRLKEEDGQDILLAGSADLFNSLLAADLIDEYRLMVYPVVVGHGKRLFRDGVDRSAFSLKETKPFASGVVVLTYEPVRE